MATQIYQTYTFEPTKIPGCQLWFDAADSSTFSFSSGTSISEWRDKSANGYSVVQPTSGSQPTLTSNALNGLAGIQFTTSSYLYQTSTSMPKFTTGPSSSVLIVARNASTNTGWNIFNTIWFTSSGVGSTQRYHLSFNQNTTDGTTLYANGVLVGQTTSIVAAPLANTILGFTISSAFATIHTNFTTTTYTPGQALPDATGSSAFIFNDPRNESAASSNVMIFEMVGYNTQISTTERQLLEGYLAWKWGLQTTLPPSHPYRFNGPFMNTLSLPVTITRPISELNNPVFLPTQISGCYLWLDASSPNNFTLSSGSNISAWIDRSENSYNATAGNNPTYDVVNKRVRFNNTLNQYMSNTAAPFNLAQRSFFFVIEDITYVSVGGYMPIIPNPTSGNDYQTTTGLTIENNTGFKFYGNSGSYDNRIAGAAAPNAKGIYSEVFRLQSGTTYLNGTAGGTSNAGYTPGTSSGYALGGRWNNGIATPYINAYYYEVLVYNNALSKSQREQVEGYLAWKWGLQSSLPITHPFYKSPFPGLSYAPNPIAPPQIKSAVFLPNQITGLSLWLDAADPSTIQTSGTKITSISDKSPSPKTITITDIVSYELKQSIVFTDTNGSFSVSGMPSAPYDVLVVATANPSNTNWRTLLRTTGNPGTHPFLLQATTNNLGMWDGTNFRQFGSLTMSTNEKALVYTTMPAERTIQAAKNGTKDLTDSTPAGNLSVIVAIGNLQLVYGAGQPWGRLQELCVYGRNLPIGQRQAIEGYLAWKWSLVSSLPLNHPYKLFPPAPL